MSNAIRIVDSAMIPCFVIVGIFALVAAFDKERPRLKWARQSLFVFGIVAISTGVLTYLFASGSVPIRGHPVKWESFMAVWRGVCYGMLTVLVASGQFWVKKAPTNTAPGAGDA